jgi:integrase
VCEHLVHAFGKHRLAADLRPPDFTTLLVRMSKGIGPVRRGNLVQRVRSVLKWAYESELIDKPIKTGPDFKKPKISILRKAKDERGPLMFSAAEIRRMLEAADPALKAMIYLGINGALGNTDCGSLQWRHIDFDRGWLTFPRPKTGIARRCPLWPETLEALRAAIAVRPQPKDDKYRDRIFVSDRGLPWTADATLREDGTTGPRIDCVTKAFRRLLDNLGLYRKRHGFYTLRHVFATIASSTLDQPAIDQITGHCDHAISAMYREYVADERLMRVAEHVRRWLTTSSGSPSNADASPTAVTSIS